MQYRVSLPFWYRLGLVGVAWLIFFCGTFLILSDTFETLYGSIIFKIVGVPSIALFSLSAVMTTGYLFGGSYLRIDRNGIALPLFPPKMTLVAWDDILYIAVHEEKKSVFIHIHMKNYAEFIRRSCGLKWFFIWLENKCIKRAYHMRVGIPRRFCDQDALQLALKSYGHGKQWPSEPFPL